MKAIVLLSGGLDSATCLAIVRCFYAADEVLAVNMYYGQKHEKEMQAAKEIAKHYGVELMDIDLSKIFAKSNCSLLKKSSHEIPAGSYSEQQKATPGKPVSTYVPFRNGLMLSAAASIAVSVEASYIYYGAHADDAAGNAYPDCSVEFVDAINAAIQEGTKNQCEVVAPFIGAPKSDIVKRGLQLGVPYDKTWSCYNGGEKPCGKCGTCIDRIKAFELNGVKDPLEY